MKLFISLFLLFSTFLYSQNFDWEWQNPKPTGADHNDAIILPNNTWMLFGNGSSILRSTNQGTSWDIMYVDENERNIYSASFVNSNVGFIAGTGGLLMKTTDGGFNWTHLNSNTTNVLWDVQFFDENNGLVVGASGIILRTTDGGANWATTNIGTTTIYKIFYVSQSVVYMGSASATTGRLFRSTDGGVNWENISANVIGIAGTIRGIFFNNANVGFLSNSTGLIFKTTDGGATWATVYNIGSTTTTIYEIKFSDLNNGYALTSAGRVLRTTDGGSNWNLINTDATRNLFGLGVQGDNSLTYRESINILIGGDSGTILKSTDGGETWVLISHHPTQEQLQRASFPSPLVGYVVGGSITTGNMFGDILKTTDGGATWVKLPFETSTRAYSVFFLNENVGFVGSTGPTGIYKTTDGGQNWVSLSTGTGVASSIIYDIKFANENLGFAMYSSSQVARTTNGGDTWSPISAGWGSAAGYDLNYVSNEAIYIVGAGGRLSKSTDNGLNFLQVSSPAFTTTTLYSTHFFNKDSGYVVGSSGRIFRTNDGFNFTLLSSPVSTSAIIYVIRFYNNNIGWFGTSTGDLYYTTNGGTDWVRSNISLGNAQGIRDIQFSGSSMWIIGTEGMIIKGYWDPNIPVELNSFAANVNGNNVILNWTTASETNNLGFEIQRSVVRSKLIVSSKEWEVVGFVNGKGTSTEFNNYSFEDNNLLNGKYSYRLKQIDFDGKFEYSNIVEVEIGIPLEYALLQNYPNPFNPSTKIEYVIASGNGTKQSVLLKVYDILGNEVATLVNEFKEPGKYEINFDAAGLSSGVYFYQLAANNFISVKKMILIR